MSELLAMLEGYLNDAHVATLTARPEEAVYAINNAKETLEELKGECGS